MSRLVNRIVTERCCLKLTITSLLCSVMLLLPLVHGGETHCDQAESKIVRRYIEDEVLPVYTEYSVVPPKKCVIQLENDLYDVYERHKYEEGSSKWVCQFCGKAFYEERFLNQHFSNRHPRHLGDRASSVCLADYCHIFRCRVMLQKQQKPQYWDRALCKSNVLDVHRAACEQTLRSCIPGFLDKDVEHRLYQALHHKVCRFLSCELYWDFPSPKTPALTVAGYIVGWMFVVLMLFIYYFISCNHFFTDDSVLDPDHRLRVSVEEKLKFFFPQGKKAITKQRTGKYSKNK